MFIFMYIKKGGVTLNRLIQPVIYKFRLTIFNCCTIKQKMETILQIKNNMKKARMH